VPTFHSLYSAYLRGKTMDWVADQLRQCHKDFVYDGDFLRRWLSRERQRDPRLVDQLFPHKNPLRAAAIRRARRN
jgi:hypothetical protein